MEKHQPEVGVRILTKVELLLVCFLVHGHHDDQVFTSSRVDVLALERLLVLPVQLLQLMQHVEVGSQQVASALEGVGWQGGFECLLVLLLV